MQKSYVFGLLLLATACAPQVTQGASQNSLEAYLTATPSVTSTPNVIVVQETPLPTPTPFIYVVQAGDTFSELAEQFKISQDDLRAANPDVSSNSMSIGMTLLIPNSSSTTGSESTLTPVPAPVTQTVCHQTADRGLWCFALIQNNTAELLENVSAQITLTDGEGNVIASQSAFTPLDIIPPHTSQPVYVFFADQASATVNLQVQLLSAVPLSANTERYLPATLDNVLTQINGNGRSAQVNGQVHLPTESTAATEVWVSATANDREGHVVGVKRWEGGALQPGATLDFNFTVASVGATIDMVEFAVQARP